uniref:Uncharacterized protein n=1 Tax=Avena sativa TaxID=4498 RepID=A0ACD5URQ4_AVESA
MENAGGEDVPEDANERAADHLLARVYYCPGTQSEAAGKAESCAGCPNQQICATAPKGPDPGNTTLHLTAGATVSPI